MKWYDDPKNVQEYINLSKKSSGAQLIKHLTRYLAQDATILEIGMGPGTDLNILKTRYQAIGSDRSKLFLERYRKQQPHADLLYLDAITLKTKRVFDGIYSNKVLHHLTKQQLNLSLQRQRDIVNPHGIVLHTFWEGDDSGVINGLFFQNYTQSELTDIITPIFEMIEISRYTEITKDDSIMVIAKNSIPRTP